MSLTEFRRKKMNRQPLIKYLLPIFTALCATALVFTGCANSADSIDSSDGKKETFTITVKTQNITSTKEAEGRSIFPVLSDSEYYTLSYKSGENADWQSLDGTFPDRYYSRNMRIRVIILRDLWNIVSRLWSSAKETSTTLPG